MEAVKKYFKSSQPSYHWEYIHGGHKNASACRESLWCYGREGSGASSKLCESRDSTGKGIFDAVGMETAHCVSYIADNAALKRVRERVWQRLWRHKIPIFRSRLVQLTPGMASSQLIVKTEVLSQYYTILIWDKREATLRDVQILCDAGGGHDSPAGIPRFALAWASTAFNNSEFFSRKRVEAGKKAVPSTSSKTASRLKPQANPAQD